MHERFFAPTIDEIYVIIKQLDTLSYNAFEETQSYDFTDMLYITYKKISNHEWEVPYWACFTNVVIDESQDLSLIQLFLLKFLKRKNEKLFSFHSLLILYHTFNPIAIKRLFFVTTLKFQIRINR